MTKAPFRVDSYRPGGEKEIPAMIPDFNREKLIVCTECRGTGRVKRQIEKPVHGWEWEMKTCDICGGKKLLKQIVTIKYEQI